MVIQTQNIQLNIFSIQFDKNKLLKLKRHAISQNCLFLILQIDFYPNFEIFHYFVILKIFFSRNIYCKLGANLH